MKRIWIVIAIFCTLVNVHSQNEKKHYFGVNYLFGSCEYKGVGLGGLYSSSTELNGTSYFGLGLDYRYRYSENTELCYGITATINKISSKIPWSSGPSYPDGNFAIFSLPVHLKYHFLNHFFLGGGPCLNIHPSRGYKSGLGFEINAGAEYAFKSGLILSVSPHVKRNFLCIFGDMDYGHDGKETLSQIGISIGLGYKFGK